MTGLQHDARLFERIFADAEALQGRSYAARRILAMSATLFYRHGAGGTSIRDITSECGLSPGALYKHFASKDDVLYALVTFGHDRVDERVSLAATQCADDAASQLAGFVHAYVIGHLESPELAQLVRREYVYLSPERFDEIVRRRRGLRQHLARLLSGGEKDGLFTLIGGDDRATRTAVMMLDMCSRTSEWYHPQRGGTPSSELAGRYVQAALRLAGFGQAQDGPGGAVSAATASEGTPSGVAG